MAQRRCQPRWRPSAHREESNGEGPRETQILQIKAIKAIVKPTQNTAVAGKNQEWKVGRLEGWKVGSRGVHRTGVTLLLFVDSAARSLARRVNIGGTSPKYQ